MRTVKLASLAIASAMALSSGGAFALEAHEEIEAALASGTSVEFEAQGVTMRAELPCDAPEAGPPSDDGVQSSVCFVGETMFIFSSSLSVPPSDSGSLSSDFDSTVTMIEESPDTTMIEVAEERGRRVIMAERGPETQFGLMRAIQFAPDGLVYAIAMSNPGDNPVSESDKQMMRNFAASLEIVE